MNWLLVQVDSLLAKLLFSFIGVRKAKVDNPRLCTMNREALRHAEFKNKVKIMHKPTHFICK
jgi:hypothetical protein